MASRGGGHPTRVGQGVKATGGKFGRVQWIGTPAGSNGTWVGVELENPDAKAGDGTFKGTRYFTCTDKHGMFQKAVLWRVISDDEYRNLLGGGGSARKGGKAKGGKKTKGGRGNASAASASGGAKPGRGKGKKPKGGGKAKGGKRGGGRATEPVEEPPAREPTPPPPPKTFQSIGIQTESYEQTTFEIAQDIVAMNDRKMRLIQKERQDADASVREKEAEIQALKNGQVHKDYQIQMLTTEKENLIQQLEEAELKNEEAQLTIEQRNDDIEDLQFQLETTREDILSQLSGGEAEMAALVEENQELVEVIADMKRKAQDQLEEHLSELLTLRSQVRFIPRMETRIDELLGAEREVIKLNGEIMSLRSQVQELLTTKTFMEELKERNIRMDSELKDLRDFVDIVDDERLLLEQLHEEDEAFVVELKEELQRTKKELSDLKKKSAKQGSEIQDLQKENFNLLEQLEKFHGGPGMTRMLSPGVGGGGDVGNSEDYNLIVLENDKLKSDLDALQDIVASQAQEVFQGRVAQIQQKLIKAYFPRTLAIDTAGLNLVSILERAYLKADFIRDLMERSFVDPKKSDEQTATHSQFLCPMIIRQTHAIRRAQFAALTLPPEQFDLMAKNWNKLSEVENIYDNLLNACHANELDTFDADNLDKQEKKLVSFVVTHCPELNPFPEKENDDQADKFEIVETLSVTKYRLISVDQRLGEFRHVVAQVKIGPGSPKKADRFPIATEEDGAEVPFEDQKYAEPEPKRELQLGIMQKMFRLQSSLLEECQQVLEGVTMLRMGYEKTKVNLQEILETSLSQVKVGQLKACKSAARQCLNRIDGMMTKLSEIDQTMDYNDRIGAVNRILDHESEIEKDGLINLLEKMFGVLYDVRNAVNENTSTKTTTDELNFSQTTSTATWEIKAQEIRLAIEEAGQLRSKVDEAERLLADARDEKFQTNQAMTESRRQVATLVAQLNQSRQDADGLSEMQQKISGLTTESEKYRLQNIDLMKERSRLQDKIAGLTKTADQLRDTLKSIRGGGKNKAGVAFTEEVLPARGAGQGRATENQRGQSPAVSGDIEEISNYSKLLEASISSLRRRLTTMRVTKSLQDTFLRLRPLRTKASDPSSIPKRVPERRDSLTDLLDDFDVLDDDEKELDGFDGMSSTEAALFSIQTKIANIRATPRVIDVTNTSKAQIGSSQFIGRQIQLKSLTQKLRDMQEHMRKRDSVEPPEPDSSGRPIRIGTVELPKTQTMLLPNNSQITLQPSDVGRLSAIFSM